MKLVELSISYIVVIFYIIINLLCFKRCIHGKMNISIKNILIVLVLAVFLMLNNLYNPSWLKVPLCIIFLIITCLLIFNQNLKKTTAIVLLIILISMILELVVAVVLPSNINNIEDVNKSYMLKSGLTILLDCLLFLVVNNKLFDQVINAYYEKNFKKIMYIIFLLLIVILTMFLSVYIHDYNNLLAYSLFMAIFIVMSLLIYQIIKKDFEQDKLLLQYNILQENINSYDSIISDYKDLKHNLNNDMLAIRSKVNKKAQQLIDEKMKKYSKEYNILTNIGQIPQGLQGIMLFKLSKLNQQGFNIEINIQEKKKFDKMNAKDYSIVSDIIGIVLDNAIEATNKCDDKTIYVETSSDKNNLYIKVINTFSDTLDLDMLGDKSYSTKKVKSGRGLHYINKISKNTKFNIKKEIINNLFITSVSINLV